MLDHKDVAVVKAQTPEGERVDNELRNGIAGKNIANAEHGYRAQFAGANNRR